jgi:hypothetical protein
MKAVPLLSRRPLATAVVLQFVCDRQSKNAAPDDLNVQRWFGGGVWSGPPRGGPLEWCLVLGSAATLGVLESVDPAGELEDLAAVDEADEGGAGESLGAEDLGPVLEGEVGRDEEALPFVSLSDDETHGRRE